MIPRAVTRRERTLELASAYVREVQHDLERASALGFDLPPRVRTVHTRSGHATPEYRTLAIPTEPDGSALAPDTLSALICRYVATRPATCLLLAMEGLYDAGAEEPYPILIAEARDAGGTRAYWMQPFRRTAGGVAWDEAFGGGWQDPGEQELILDAAFTAATLTTLAHPEGPTVVPA